MNGLSEFDPSSWAASPLTRPGLSAISLRDATAAVTGIGNDYSYDEVFARQVLAAGRPGDVVVGMTTTGKSGQRGAGAGGRRGRRDDHRRGDRGGRRQGCRGCRDFGAGAGTDTARVQEACMHLGHVICEMVEAALFPRQ